MSPNDEWMEMLPCPVCAATQRVTEAIDLCAVCGWEFMFFNSMIPPLLVQQKAQQLALQKKIRAQFEAHQKWVEAAEKQIKVLETQIAEPSQRLQTLVQKQQALKQEIGDLRPKMANVVDLSPEIQQIRPLWEGRESENEFVAMEKTIPLECSYHAKVIRVVCPKHISISELPRLVLGMSSKKEIMMVTQAEIIYLLPVCSEFKRRSDAQNWILEYDYSIPLPKLAYFKFGSYQFNSIFNIITKK